MKTLHAIHTPTPGLVWIGPNRPCPTQPCDEPSREMHHQCVATYFGLPDDNDPDNRVYYCECSRPDCDTDYLHYFRSVNYRYICEPCQRGEHPTP